MDQQRAVIDIGSNTVRLVILGGPARAPVVLFNEKATARLGRGLDETGLLSPKAMDTALTALARFATILRLRGVDEVQTVATAAARDAANGPAFLDAVRALGLSPRLLSGEEEAQASAEGVIAAFPGARGIVADIGGGSLELITIADGACGPGISLPLGTLRLAAMRAADPKRLAARIDKHLPPAFYRSLRGQTVYLVGGAHRALAHYAIAATGWPLDDPHGFALDPERAQRHCRAILRSGVSGPVPGASAARVQALPDTAALLRALLRRLAPSGLVFSSWGLREGLLQTALPARIRAADPLLTGVSAFARRLDAGADPVAAMVAWAGGAFAARDAGETRLRLASAWLALALQRVEPNLRPSEALHWALQKRWIGIDAAGRALLATTLLADTGRGALPEALVRLCDAEALRRARAWGIALRLCRRFSALAPGALAASRLIAGNGRLVLSLDPVLRALPGDGTERDLRALAALLELDAQVHIAQPD